MTNLETVAAQRDELSTKLRDAIKQRDAALAEVARLKAAMTFSFIEEGEPIQTKVYGEVPAVTPPKSKRQRIFGSKMP